MTWGKKHISPSFCFHRNSRLADSAISEHPGGKWEFYLIEHKVSS